MMRAVTSARYPTKASLSASNSGQRTSARTLGGVEHDRRSALARIAIRPQAVAPGKRKEQLPGPRVSDAEMQLHGRSRLSRFRKASLDPRERCFRRSPLAGRGGAGEQRLDLAQPCPQLLLGTSCGPLASRSTSAVLPPPPIPASSIGDRAALLLTVGGAALTAARTCPPTCRGRPSEPRPLRGCNRGSTAGTPAPGPVQRATR